MECDRAGETSVKEIEQKATERSCKAQTHRRVPHRRNGDGPSSRPSVPEEPSHRAVHASTPTRVASGPGAPSGFRPTFPARQTGYPTNEISPPQARRSRPLKSPAPAGMRPDVRGCQRVEWGRASIFRAGSVVDAVCPGWCGPRRSRTASWVVPVVTARAGASGEKSWRGHRACACAEEGVRWWSHPPPQAALLFVALRRAVTEDEDHSGELGVVLLLPQPCSQEQRVH